MTKMTSVDDCFEKSFPFEFGEPDREKGSGWVVCRSNSASCSRANRLHTRGSSPFHLQFGDLGWVLCIEPYHIIRQMGVSR